ncbi:unnamed protein product [Peniophora sp. CBMAI 1063]|nr:unnamed protein product [Peniophora sp. CBMAI 1063]
MSLPPAPTMEVDGGTTVVTPEMIRAPAVDQMTDTAIKFVKEARGAVMRTLMDIRVPQKELREDFDPDACTGDGQQRPPLMHFGFAMSWTQVIALLRRHNYLHSPSMPFKPTLANLSKTRSHPHLNIVEKDALRDRLLLVLGFKTGEELAMNECLTPKSVRVVISLYTNYSKGSNGWWTDEDRRQEVMSALRNFLRSKNYNPDEHLNWYWDAKWCGLGYSAPDDAFNPWPAAQNSRWRTHFDNRSPDEGKARRTIDTKGDQAY